MNGRLSFLGSAEAQKSLGRRVGVRLLQPVGSEREREREIDRQTDRQRNRQRARQIDRGIGVSDELCPS